LELEKYKVLISIIAPFRFGKTSLLYAYIDIAKKFRRIINIYLPLKTVDNSLSVIIKSLSEKLPEIKNISYKEGLYLFFKNVNAILKKKDLWVILYINEFQFLPDRIRKEGFLTKWDNKDIFMFFRGLTEEFRIGLVVSGSYIGELLDTISVWSGRFLELRLGPFP